VQLVFPVISVAVGGPIRVVLQSGSMVRDSAIVSNWGLLPAVVPTSGLWNIGPT
jgi:hypothetical protein